LARINLDIVENAFSSKSTLSYELSILIGSDSVYYMVNDAQLNILALKSFHFDMRQGQGLRTNLKEVFFEDLLLREQYRTSKIVFTTPYFTFVPNKLYNEEFKNQYFANLTQVGEEAVYEADYFKPIDAQNVYVNQKDILNMTKTFFPYSKLYHNFSSLALGYQKIAEIRIGKQVFLNIRDGFVQLCYFEDATFVFANSYSYRSPQDVIYFVMLVYDQFKLDPEFVPLCISGSVTEDSDIYRFIFRYIKKVSFTPLPSYFRFGHQFGGIPQHFYFDLFSIKLCE
jgi:hypothetical protein